MSEYHWEHSGEPLEEQWVHAAEQQDEGAAPWAEMQPIPVHIKRTEVEQTAPAGASLISVQIPLIPALAGTGGVQPATLCPHNYHRYKAKFTWTIPANCTIYVATVKDHLTSGAVANLAQIIVGATAITTSQSGLFPDWECAKPLYAMATVAGAQCSVVDENYKVVQ